MPCDQLLHSTVVPQSYPFADLLRAARIDGLADEAIAELLGTSKRTVTRWHMTGIPIDASERAAIALGEVPEAVWLTWLDDMIARDEARLEARRAAAAHRSARRRERRRESASESGESELAA